MLIPSRKWQKAGVSNYKLCLRNSVSNTSLRIFWNQVFQYEEEWLGCVMNGSACERLMTVIGSNSILCNTTKDSIHKTQYAWCMSINLWMVLKYGSLFLSQESAFFWDIIAKTYDFVLLKLEKALYHMLNKCVT